MYLDTTGGIFLAGFFAAILSAGTAVSETREFRRSFYRTGAQINQKNLSTEIRCYRGERTTAPDWLDMEPDKFPSLCTVEADISNVLKSIQPRHGPQGIYYRQDFDIVLLFGMTELKAQLSWIENGQEKRGPARVVYDTLPADSQ